VGFFARFPSAILAACLLVAWHGDLQAQGAASSTALTATWERAPFPPLYNEPVTLTAKVSAAGPPTGSVTFKWGTTVLCNAVPLAAAQAQCTVGLISFRSDMVAEYSGDATYAASTSPVLTLQSRDGMFPGFLIVKSGNGSGAVTLARGDYPPQVTCDETQQSCLWIEYAWPMELPFVFDARPAFGSRFDGWSGGGCSGTGRCSLLWQALENVDTTITAVFIASGEPTTTTLVSSANPSAVGQPITFTAQVVHSHGTPLATGPVTFTANGSPICSAVALVPAESSSGTSTLAQAQCTTSALAEGTHVVIAEYAGTDVFMPSASQPLSQSVQAPGPITVVKSGAGSGRVVSSPEGIDCGSTCSMSFPPGTSVTLSADPAPGHVFVGWSGACVFTTLCRVTAGLPLTITARFEPSRLAGLSTRVLIGSNDDVGIAGFAIDGASAKTVVVRARGPSLTEKGVLGALGDPTLTLVPKSGPSLTNDDWGTGADAATLAASGFAPSHAKEAAIIATLEPGAYTAVVGGMNGATGVAILEVYELEPSESALAGLSTRGRVETGENIMIGGFIIQGAVVKTVVIRARGPSLTAEGVSGVLADPQLAVVSQNGTVLRSNDNWQQFNGTSATLQALGFAPTDSSEAAIVATLPPGAYTVHVNGKASGTGVGLFEVYEVTP